MTYNLKTMIKNETEKDNTEAASIAKKMGYKDRNTLYKFLNESERKCQKFGGLVEVVKEYFSDIENQVMSDFSETIYPTIDTARFLLEYANLNRMSDLQVSLFERMREGGNVESKDWVKIYELDLLHTEEKIDDFEYITKLHQFKSRFKEVTAFKNLLIMYYNYSKKHISVLLDTSESIEKSISDIVISSKGDGYIKQSYYARFGLVMVGVYLNNGDVNKSRELGNRILKSGASAKVEALIHLQLGNGYIMEDYDLAMNHYSEGIKLVPDHDKFTIDNFKRSINFLCAHYAKAPMFIMDIEEVRDAHNSAYYFINKGNNEKALKVLETVNFEEISSMEKGYNRYYMGLLHNDKTYLYESIKYFKKDGKYNLCNYSVEKLKEIGESQALLDALIA